MNREKAKELLEKLMTRTEARGATQAEAIQAAELAEKIAKRYGLDADAAGHQTRTYKVKNLPEWASLLLICIQDRFDIQVLGKYGKIKPMVLRFNGPEHRTKIAVWLFNAIRKDLDNTSYVAGRALGKKGGEFLRFRNQFRMSAVARIHERLNPETEAEKEEREKIVDEFMKNCKPCKAKRLTAAETRQLELDHVAWKHGCDAGDKIKIDTNVLPNQKALAIEHCGSKAGCQ